MSFIGYCTDASFLPMTCKFINACRQVADGCHSTASANSSRRRRDLCILQGEMTGEGNDRFVLAGFLASHKGTRVLQKTWCIIYPVVSILVSACLCYCVRTDPSFVGRTGRGSLVAGSMTAVRQRYRCLRLIVPCTLLLSCVPPNQRVPFLYSLLFEQPSCL